jgi:predicted AAA+ superfamily ATPase
MEMTRDWIYGECAATGRPRASLLGVLACLHRFGGTPVGQAKLAREAGLANNTVAAGYVELLTDLLCVASAYAWDETRHRHNPRRPCKYHMTNLLAAIAWHPARLRSLEECDQLAPPAQAMLMEWLVAQELWRRAAIRDDEMPERMAFWQSPSHEVDFVVEPHQMLEVKRGPTTPLEFGWFPKAFPDAYLTVISHSRYETTRIRGVTLEEFLLT